VSARTAAKALGAGRAVLGLAVLAAPEQVTSRWLGGHARKPLVRYLARSLGARDLALGALTLLTVDEHRLGPKTLLACAAADAVDAAATVAVRRQLPRRGTIATVLIAGAAALYGGWLAHELRPH
jgi:hypothetical protein